MSCAETAEAIEMSFRTWTPADSRKHVLDKGTHWRHLTNTTESSMCGGAALTASYYNRNLYCYHKRCDLSYGDGVDVRLVTGKRLFAHSVANVPQLCATTTTTHARDINTTRRTLSHGV